MSVTTMTPRMKKALRDGKQLYFFADLWKSVLNDRVDTQEEFKSSLSSTNMDFDFNPGYARIAIEQDIFNINQATQNTYQSAYASNWYYGLVQSFRISPGRQLSHLTLYIGNSTGAAKTSTVKIFNANPYGLMKSVSDWPGLVCTLTATIAGSATGEVVFSCPYPINLPEGTYYLFVTGPTGLNFYYQNTNAYAGGGLARFGALTGSLGGFSWADWSGYDLYFKLSLSGYYLTGSFLTKTLDLGKIPNDTGFFQMAADVPVGTSLGVTLSASNTGAFGGEETVFSDVQDGFIAPAFQYWRILFNLSCSAARDLAPLIDMAELYFPDDRIRFRQKNAALRNVDEEIRRDFEALLVPGSMSLSDLDIINHVSSLGTINIRLEDANLDRLQKIVSDCPLKNFRVAVYVGADEPGFRISDLFRHFIGIVESADVIPKYRGQAYSIDISVKNPMLDLKRKIPLPDQTGLLDFEIVAIDEDGSHCLDAALNLFRKHARIPARYIDVGSFVSGKSVAGSGSPAPAAHIVFRSNSTVEYSDGTLAPDTRIKSPEELMGLLTPLCMLADGYVVVDEGSRIKFVHHDLGTGYEETWADEALVRSGVDAIPIQTISKISLGYSDLLYNLSYCACEWDGQGSDWGASFKKVFANANAESADDFAPGRDTYYSIMEKNMVDVSKWLGPEDGYNGETLAAAMAARMVNRFSYPPVRISGAVLPISQFEHGQGSIIRIFSKEFAKFRRRGIALSETLRFIVTKVQYDQGANRMVFDLLELT